jgi:dynein assembly factor 5
MSEIPEKTTTQETGTHFIINHNLKGLLNILLEQIIDFKQPTQLKIKSLTSLSFIIQISGKAIEPDFFIKNNGILSCIYKYMIGEEALIKKCDECSVIIGKSTDQNIIIPLLIQSINEIETNNNLEALYVRIRFLSNYLKQLQNISLENGELIINSLNNIDIFNLQQFSYTKNLLYSYANLLGSLINCLKGNCTKVNDKLFFPLLLLISLPETQAIRPEIQKTFQVFAENCKMSIEELYSYEIGNILEKFKTSYKTWKKNSPDRFAFDIYVKLAGASLEKHWTEVLLIISQCCESEKDIEIRMDMIILLDKIISNKVLFEQIKNYTEFILPEILFPATAWRVGRPNYKVRKAAVVDMIHLFQNNLITPELVIQFFKDFVSNFKTILDDDWDAELRYLGIQVFKLFILCAKDSFKYDHVADLYQMIMKRLDDSQDTNRILTCEVLTIFMGICRRVKLSESIYDYIIENTFIHLDDNSEKVRNAVEGFLRDALTMYPKNFWKFIEKNQNSFTHKGNLLALRGECEKLL